MTIQTMTDNLLAKNKEDFVESFLHVMAEKVSEALDTKREEIAGSMFQKEETELEEAKAAGVDEYHATEIFNNGVNDAKHYNNVVRSFIPNVVRKMKRGVYDHDKAGQLYKYHADRVAADLEKNHEYPHASVATRRAAGKMFADHYRDEAEEIAKKNSSVKESFSDSITNRAGITGIPMSAKDKMVNIPGRMVKGTSYGARVKTDDMGDEIYDDPNVEPLVKRGRGRPSKAVEHGGKVFDSAAIADFMKQRMAGLPKARASFKHKGA